MGNTLLVLRRARGPKRCTRTKQKAPARAVCPALGHGDEQDRQGPCPHGQWEEAI